MNSAEHDFRGAGYAKIDPRYGQPNGELKLTFGSWWWQQTVFVVGGPYRRRTDGHFGVCLRERWEPNLEPDAHVPIEDFSIPLDLHALDRALRATLAHAIEDAHPETGHGKFPVWVGCAGGWGRTGIFLSLLVKIACPDIPDPVGYVRDHYARAAVETLEQEQFVERYDVAELRAYATACCVAKFWWQPWRMFTT